MTVYFSMYYFLVAEIIHWLPLVCWRSKCYCGKVTKRRKGTWLLVIEYCCIACTLLDTRSRGYMTRIGVILIYHITLLKLWEIIYSGILHTNRLCQDSHLSLNTYCSLHYSVLSTHHIVSMSLENGFLLVWFIVHII